MPCVDYRHAEGMRDRAGRRRRGRVARRGRVRGRGLGHARQTSLAPSAASSCPNLQELGLGNVMPLEGCPPRRRAGRRGPAARALAGQGHDHRALGAGGRRHRRRDADVPGRVPAGGDRRVREATGRGVLGNKPASGTEIIQQLGDEHQRPASGSSTRPPTPSSRWPPTRSDPARGALRRLPRGPRDPDRRTPSGA